MCINVCVLLLCASNDKWLPRPACLFIVNATCAFMTTFWLLRGVLLPPDMCQYCYLRIIIIIITVLLLTHLLLLLIVKVLCYYIEVVVVIIDQ